MHKYFVFFVVLALVLIAASKTLAFEITSDPQYIVINEADLKEQLQWDAPEKEWNEKIKPRVLEKLRHIEGVLTVGNKNRRLAWSIILTYMDYPMDNPSRNSPYAVMTRRILEIAEELDFPVFLPLNGFQWWNQLPELWNYWDFDGNQTEGCTNDEYDKYEELGNGNKNYKCKFPELRDPEFRRRFIKGYNPKNIWNVEWEDWERPMGLNWRDWGGGPFEHAPVPNIISQSKVYPSYQSVLRDRFRIIIDEIRLKLDEWEEKKKQGLFAGLSIGTEISLNASINLSNEFIPYGYRAVQDLVCTDDNPKCGKDTKWNFDTLEKKRQEVVYQYLNNLAKIVVGKGIPKQRIYTHVWSETTPDEKRYTNYFISAFNLYSRPGLSLYGYGDRPFELPALKEALEEHGNVSWAAPEFGSSAEKWLASFLGTLDNSKNPAKLIDIYNWREIKGTPAIPALQQLLKQEPNLPSCKVSEILPQTKTNIENPKELSWQFLNPNDEGEKNYIIISRYKMPESDILDENSVELPKDTNSYSVPKDKFGFGLYYWFVKRVGCDGKTWTTSSPRSFQIFPVIKKQKLNWWENLFQSLKKRFL